jgi:hypothetical protein
MDDGRESNSGRGTVWENRGFFFDCMSDMVWESGSPVKCVYGTGEREC